MCRSDDDEINVLVSLAVT